MLKIKAIIQGSDSIKKIFDCVEKNKFSYDVVFKNKCIKIVVYIEKADVDLFQIFLDNSVDFCVDLED